MLLKETSLEAETDVITGPAMMESAGRRLRHLIAVSLASLAVAGPFILGSGIGPLGLAWSGMAALYAVMGLAFAMDAPIGRRPPPVPPWMTYGATIVTVAFAILVARYPDVWAECLSVAAGICLGLVVLLMFAYFVARGDRFWGRPPNAHVGRALRMALPGVAFAFAVLAASCVVALVMDSDLLPSWSWLGRLVALVFVILVAYVLAALTCWRFFDLLARPSPLSGRVERNLSWQCPTGAAVINAMTSTGAPQCPHCGEGMVPPRPSSPDRETARAFVDAAFRGRHET